MLKIIDHPYYIVQAEIKALRVQVVKDSTIESADQVQDMLQGLIECVYIWWADEWACIYARLIWLELCTCIIDDNFKTKVITKQNIKQKLDKLHEGQ